MKLIVVTGCLFAMIWTSSADSAPSSRDGSYFGNSPPSEDPRVFEIPRSIKRFDCLEYGTFAPGGTEFCFSAADDFNYSNARIMCTRLEDGKWTDPKTAAFSGGEAPDWGAHFSADGRRLFFGSGRGQPHEKAWRLNVWIVERSAKGWSEPLMLPFNDPNVSDYAAPSASNGAIYFCSRRGGGPEKEVFSAHLVRGEYRAAAHVGPPVDSRYLDWVLVSPDEDFLVVSSDRPEGFGKRDLYVSHRGRDGSWEKARNLGPEINTAADEALCVSAADGRYLFFERDKVMHWARSTVIDKATEYPYVTKAIADHTQRVGKPLHIRLPDSFASDRGGATLTLTATIAGGEPLPSWLRFDPVESVFSGVPPSVHNYKIRVHATDERRQVAFNDFTLHVVDVYSPPVQLANLQKGLVYSYYEGRWDKLPDFSKLLAKKTGVVDNFDLDARTSFHDLAFVFEGLIEIRAEGFYRFFLNANGGARLLVDGHVIVDHDGLHHVRESAVGAVGLKPGKHELVIQYFKQHRVPNLRVSYEGPGIEKRTIPADILSCVPRIDRN